MRIGQLGAAGYGSQVTRATKKHDKDAASKDKVEQKRFQRRDTFTPSGTAPEHIKADSIEEVKQRVQQGFYDSEQVSEDLSDVFTKLFNRKV